MTKSVWRWERSGRGARIAVIFAISVGMLLLNSISLAPATHHHDEVHDSHDCYICTFIMKACWAPAASPPTPDLPRVAVMPPAPEIRPHTAGVYPLPPVRGPPVTA